MTQPNDAFSEILRHYDEVDEQSRLTFTWFQLERERTQDSDCWQSCAGWSTSRVFSAPLPIFSLSPGGRRPYEVETPDA